MSKNQQIRNTKFTPDHRESKNGHDFSVNHTHIHRQPSDNIPAFSVSPNNGTTSTLSSSAAPCVGLGAERRGGGDQRFHSPTAWLPPGHEPGAGGVAQLPSSKKGGPLGPEDFWIDDATPWSRRSVGVAARRQARLRARAHTARTDRSRHARHAHSACRH